MKLNFRNIYIFRYQLKGLSLLHVDISRNNNAGVLTTWTIQRNSLINLFTLVEQYMYNAYTNNNIMIKRKTFVICVERVT